MHALLTVLVNRAAPQQPGSFVSQLWRDKMTPARIATCVPWQTRTDVFGLSLQNYLGAVTTAWPRDDHTAGRTLTMQEDGAVWRWRLTERTLAHSCVSWAHVQSGLIFVSYDMPSICFYYDSKCSFRWMNELNANSCLCRQLNSNSETEPRTIRLNLMLYWWSRQPGFNVMIHSSTYCKHVHCSKTKTMTGRSYTLVFKCSTKITLKFTTAAITPHIQTKVKFKSQQSCQTHRWVLTDSLFGELSVFWCNNSSLCWNFNCS